MSLTSFLRDPDSRVRRWIADSLPELPRIASIARSQFTGGPDPAIPSRDKGWANVIGMAFDYRVRYMFELVPAGGFVASLAGPGESAGYATAFLDWVDQQVPAIDPVRRSLDPNRERLLDRICIVLALMEGEAWSRGGHKRDVFGALGTDLPMYNLDVRAWIMPDRTVDTILALAPQWAVEELDQLADGFMQSQQKLLLVPAAIHPVFAGSSLVGGADADLVVDGNLIDLKVRSHPGPDLLWLQQIVGYALLDSDDRYRLEYVSIYSARYRQLFTWSLRSLVIEASRGSELEALRSEFSLHLRHLEDRDAITVEQAAELAGCSSDRVLDAIATGALHPVRRPGASYPKGSRSGYRLRPWEAVAVFNVRSSAGLD